MIQNQFESKLLSINNGKYHLIPCVIDTKKCYCEHPNGRTPDNGIMCGIHDDYQLIAYCHEHQDCTGPNDPEGALLITIVEQLCDIGML